MTSWASEFSQPETLSYFLLLFSYSSPIFHQFGNQFFLLNDSQIHPLLSFPTIITLVLVLIISTWTISTAMGLLSAFFSHTLGHWFKHLLHFWWFHNASMYDPRWAGPRIRTTIQFLLSSPLHHDLSVSVPQTWCSSQTELFWVLNLGFLLFFFFILLLSLVNNPVPPIFSTKITSCMNSFLPNKKEQKKKKKKRERKKKEQITPSLVPHSPLLFITMDCCKAFHILSSD